ncbi:Mitochondrial inner membrane magnesium transporter mrs2 [Hirsutella minnesotensis 3608]|uniref:Magnesium transporter n=1 Tax=Hirsutella minnesotensis 3608 TaxID=1043627 RepID=A0A0F8A121_9HYPO|nr:Mitochondrial inner membrane magnesium transporter mrs2 [Hirsutella minnesotensis 3608]
MQPAVRPTAPSRNLLKFLRLQAEAVLAGPRSARCSELCRRSKWTSLGSHGRGARPLTTVACGPRTQSQSTRRDVSASRPAKLRLYSTEVPRRPSDAQAPKVDAAVSWQERLWGSTARRGAKPLKPTDLPLHDEFTPGSSMFNSRRVMAAKAALEPRLRCTEVDENGKVILVDGEFKKTELIAKFGLLPRDLRKIDSSNLPHILIRPSAILLNLLHLKVLIKHDRVLLFDVYGSKTSYPQSAFMYDLQGRLQQKPSQGSNGLPYEFRALEAVLSSVTSEMEADFEAVREPVMHILSELEDDIDRDKLRGLLILSKRVSTFEQKAKLVRDAIEELLEADDDLAAMYLTEKRHDLYRGTDDHTEIEMLLESYHKLTDEIVQEAGNLVSGIRNTEEIVRAILDANRNALMLLDLKFSVGTLGLAMGTFLAGLYGMNLENFIEETNWGFGAVTSVSTAFSLLVCWYGLAKLRKVQRIKMMSHEHSHLPRGIAFREDGALGVLDSRNREMLRRAHMQRAMTAKKGWLKGWR